MMTTREALEVLAAEVSVRRVAAAARGDAGPVVLTTMTAVGVWPQLSDTPLDFAYLPSAMGQGPTLGLGLALACPGRGVIVVNGDGSLLMNLGCLVTLAHNPADVYLMILDNGLYEVTGGQPTAGSGRIDFTALARGAGLQRSYAWDNLAGWRTGAAEALSGPGPVLIWLRVQGQLNQKTPAAPRSMAEQVRRLRQGLGV
jgi:thiamine pyrophosphate-dependent acetolactate synthase large subunit-like protein